MPVYRGYAVPRHDANGNSQNVSSFISSYIGGLQPSYAYLSVTERTQSRPLDGRCERRVTMDMKEVDMLRKLAPALLAAVFFALPLAAGLHSTALAQSPDADSVRVRGSIVNFNGQTLTVKTREGGTVNVGLKPGWMVSSVARATINDIKPGDFVGIASLPTKDGGDGALEVLIFPPALKGTGEGSYGWDLKPNSTMTNATVANAVKNVNGRTVTVAYHGNEKKISIPDATPVVTFAPATEGDLKPGAAVFIPAEKAADGAITTQRVVVGTNGVVPPM